MLLIDLRSLGWPISFVCLLLPFVFQHLTVFFPWIVSLLISIYIPTTPSLHFRSLEVIIYQVLARLSLAPRCMLLILFGCHEPTGLQVFDQEEIRSSMVECRTLLIVTANV